LKQSRRFALVFILSAALIAVAAFILKHHCPASGFAFSTERRKMHRLKNRTAIPQPADFDPAVTLEKMLQPGDDHARWSSTRAARVEGYVVSLARGPIELTNCYLPCSRDIHIHVGLRPDAPPREQVVLEITPRMQDWARHQGQESAGRQAEESAGQQGEEGARKKNQNSSTDHDQEWARQQGGEKARQEGEGWASYQGSDWSEETLRRELLGQWCSFEGWLLYDSYHADEAENTAPGRAGNWRATAWEIHPITNFAIRRAK
jgi:hypothetical protein